MQYAHGMDPLSPGSVVADDSSFSGDTAGHVTVASGVTLTIAGRHSGSVELQSESELLLLGSLDGRLEVGSLAVARISGSLSGPVDIKVAGTLVVEAGGSINGPVTNFGSLTNFGRRAGRVTGRAPDDRAGSSPTA